MQVTLYNDLAFSHYIDYILDDDAIDETQRHALIQAKIENEMQSKKTVENMLFAIKSKGSRVELLREKIKELSGWIHNEEKKIDRINAGIKSYMELKGIDTFETETFKIKIKKNPPKLIICSEDNVPPEYKIIETVVKIKKDEIKKDIKNGADFDWAELQQDTRIEY